MEYLKLHYNSLATVIFVFIIVIAHIVSPDFYDFTQNTISDLGAQAYDRKAIMQTGFLIFGMIVVSGIFLNGFSLRTLPVLIYALSVAMTGIFCTKPFFSGVSFSETHASVHAFFAQLAGVAFSTGILVQVFYEAERSLKTIHFVFFLLVIGLSASFGLLQNYQGIAQRLLYFVSFIWFVRFYKG
ncbi:MAG: DUF998 domain-containing protein [Bacteroidia bacterium]|nr:DUF998 domain-containing protein [Bacteroidia bacterium]